MACSGNGTEHCCWLTGQLCPYLRENEVEGRRWSCALYTQYGGWEGAITSQEYQTHVQPFWDTYQIPNLSCADWPLPGMTCNGCGHTG